MADIITPFGTTTFSLPKVVMPVRDYAYRCPVCGRKDYACT